jgi:hypothetical protein
MDQISTVRAFFFAEKWQKNGRFLAEKRQIISLRTCYDDSVRCIEAGRNFPTESFFT